MQLHTSYLVCATPRSGSTLLCEALTNTGISGRPEEYFQPIIRRPQDYFIGWNRRTIIALLGNHSWQDDEPSQPATWSELDTLKERSYANYFTKVLEEGTTANGVFGAKVMWDYLDSFISNLQQIPAYRELAVPDLLATAFPNLHYIWVTRRDKLRQAVSLWKAIQTWTWREDESLPPERETSHKTRELRFDFEAIDHLLQQTQAHEDAWQHYFEANGISPYRVVYEELAAAYEETALNILHYLNIPIPENLVFAQRSMRRQADALSEEWVQQYHLLKRPQGTVLPINARG